jgi:hypothetical protein
MDTITKIYGGQTLTKEMVLSIVDKLENWEQLEKDLLEINYPCNFKDNSDDKKKSKWKLW